MTITATDVCPECWAVLVAVPDAEPWCGACEWNLDSYSPAPHIGWVWTRIRRVDRRAGFRADKLLAELSGQDPEAPLPSGPYRILLAVSAALMLLLLASLAGAGWLFAVHAGPGPVFGGVLLLVLAWCLRPRFGRLKKMLKPGYRVPENQAPALRALIGQVADEIGAPRPDVLAFDFSWNAGAAAVGVRRTRVLMLGVPLLLATTPAELVAMLGHELGHFKYEDHRRFLLTRPALTVFGAFSNALRPPPGDISASRAGGLGMVILLGVRLVAGTLSLLFYAVHVAMNVLNGRDSRRVELRADTAAVRVGGSAATLAVVDLFALEPTLRGYVQHHVPKGEAAATWRRMLKSVRARHGVVAPVVRQHSMRTNASLLSSHPSPGRRHQWLSTLPDSQAAIVLDEATAARVEREIAPYAEAMHETMLDVFIS